MRAGLLFKLPLRKPNIFLSEPDTFNYTFLELEHLMEQLQQNP